MSEFQKQHTVIKLDKYGRIMMTQTPNNIVVIPLALTTVFKEEIIRLTKQSLKKQKRDNEKNI